MNDVEPILEPDLPIVDAHHHLWFMAEGALSRLEQATTIASRAFIPLRRSQTEYLFDALLSDLRCGHNVCATVFVDAHAMYRQSGPQEMRSVGEVEFANGVAAMSASGAFGNVRACAAIVGNVDLRMGDAVVEVLEAHVRAGGGRYRGVRGAERTAHDDDTSILGPGIGVPHILLDERFRSGFKWLQKLDLSFDAWLLEPQLPELIDLARAFPETRIVLNHAGCPVAVGRYSGKREERFPLWRRNMQTLASFPQVFVKLGGFGMPFGAFEAFAADPPASSTQLAEEWRPYVETCIELFGVDRCMFESNFPVDARTCSYAVLWNTFKRLVAGASAEEKTALFSGTASRAYRIEL